MSRPEERLAAARLAAQREPTKGGIGTLGEKQLHAILKYYYEPDPVYHEVPLQGYVADIRTPERIIEIQTRSFNKLRQKLAVFLQEAPVSLVYPLPYRKWLRWIDPQSGEVSEPRKSPKTGQAAEACFELSMIQDLLTHPQLRVILLLLDVEEYRYLDGWSRDRKKGSSRAERLPLAIVEELCLDSPRDYLRLLPSGLPQNFTCAELAQAARLSTKRSQQLLRCLYKLGVLERHKQGRSYLYHVKAATEPGGE